TISPSICCGTASTYYSGELHLEWTVCRGESMRPDWRIDSAICTIGFTGERTGRSHQGEYGRKAGTVSQRYIPKADGRQRPLGIAALEDKIVQQAVVTIVNQIYEVDFKGFSYGFRPGRSPHQARDALNVGIFRKRVNWVLDADTRGVFDNMSHEWTMKFIEHRVTDRRMLGLVQKWLKVGVSEDGQWRKRM